MGQQLKELGAAQKLTLSQSLLQVRDKFETSGDTWVTSETRSAVSGTVSAGSDVQSFLGCTPVGALQPSPKIDESNLPLQRRTSEGGRCREHEDARHSRHDGQSHRRNSQDSKGRQERRSSRLPEHSARESRRAREAQPQDATNCTSQ